MSINRSAVLRRKNASENKYFHTGDVYKINIEQQLHQLPKHTLGVQKRTISFI